MLLEWYKNGLAESYIIFRNEKKEMEGLSVARDNNIKKSFEGLMNNRKEFENFLDQHKEIPFGNVKIKVEREGKPTYYDIKALFPRSSKQRVVQGKTIWEVIGFKEKSKRGKCSLCGNLGVKKNTVLLFPFERKVLNYFSVLNERKRLKLCPLCQKICFYSFGNIFYNKSNDRVTIFFPTSEDYEKIAELAEYLKEIRLTDMETNYYSNIRPKGISAHYPFEFLYPILFALYRWTKEKKEDLNEILSNVRIELISYIKGRGLNIFDSYDSITRLDMLFKIFKQFENNIEKLNAEHKTKGKDPLTLSSSQIFNIFFNNLQTLSGKKLEDKNRLREEWVKTLLRKFKVNYIKLNEIVMDNIKIQKRTYRFIGFYTLIINSILEVINMEEKQLFEKINGLGWHLIADKLKEGGMAKEQMKSFVWDIFRTRTPEDFVDAVVAIQLKLRTNLDLREIHGNKSRWREIRAILLNGMANALYSKKEEGGK